MIRKNLGLTIALGSLLFSLSQPASAGVGIGTGALPVMIAGGLSAALGVWTIPAGITTLFTVPHRNTGLQLMGAGGLTAAAGFVALDDSNESAFKFIEITEENAKKLGVTAEQAQAFNDHIEILNAWADDIKSRMAVKVQGIGTVTQEHIEWAKAEWSQALGQLSDGAREVAGRLSNQIISSHIAISK